MKFFVFIVFLNYELSNEKDVEFVGLLNDQY